MRFMLSVGLVLAAVEGVLAQGTVLQGGPVTAGHAPMYSESGTSQPIVVDSGPAGGGAIGLGISELLVTARGPGAGPYAGLGTGPDGTINCTYDGPTTGMHHYLCLSANAQGGGLITYGAGAGAPTLPLYLSVNGTAYELPFSVGGIVGPPTTTVGYLACWNNVTGTLLAQCLDGVDVNILVPATGTARVESSGGVPSPFSAGKTTVSATTLTSVPTDLYFLDNYLSPNDAKIMSLFYNTNASVLDYGTGVFMLSTGTNGDAAGGGYAQYQAALKVQSDVNYWGPIQSTQVHGASIHMSVSSNEGATFDHPVGLFVNVDRRMPKRVITVGGTSTAGDTLRVVWNSASNYVSGTPHTIDTAVLLGDTPTSLAAKVAAALTADASFTTTWGMTAVASGVEVTITPPIEGFGLWPVLTVVGAATETFTLYPTGTLTGATTYSHNTQITDDTALPASEGGAITYNEVDRVATGPDCVICGPSARLRLGLAMYHFTDNRGFRTGAPAASFGPVFEVGTSCLGGGCVEAHVRSILWGGIGTNVNYAGIDLHDIDFVSYNGVSPLAAIRLPPGDTAEFGIEFDTGHSLYFNTSLNQYHMMGDALSIDGVAEASLRVSKGASGEAAFLSGMTNMVERWRIYLGDQGAEAGSDAGSLAILEARTDAGAAKFDVWSAERVNGIMTIRYPKLGMVTTVAALPACDATWQDVDRVVTDANATTFNSVVAGGGANRMKVRCVSGTGWLIN